MAQKKGLIYRVTMGRDDMPDFTPAKLPGTRWGLFKDVFFNRFGAMVKISLLTTLFCVPMIAWLIIMYFVRQVDGAMIPYSGNIGIGYPVVIDAQSIGVARAFYYDMAMYVGMIPWLLVAGIGFSGAFYVMKLLAWGEGVSVTSNFWKGIRQNWKKFFVFFLFAAFSAFLYMFNLSSYSYLTDMPDFLRTMSLIFATIQFVLMLIIMMFLTTQSVMYTSKMGALFKNSILFAIALLPQNLFFLVLSLLPIVIISLLSLDISIFLWIAFALVGFSYVILVWTVYAHWAYDKYINGKIKAEKRRGMREENPEAEKEAEIAKILARNTSYGAAYVSRRMSSIDKGKSFTPLQDSFSRADLEKLQDEKSEMTQEIDKEIEDIDAQIEKERLAYEAEQAALSTRKGRKAAAKREKEAEKKAEKERKAKKKSDEGKINVTLDGEKYTDDEE